MDRFKTKEFVVFDVETTGLSPAIGDRIVEIAALKIKNLEPVAHFHSLVDPQRPISFPAFEVNQISEKMLVGAPKAREILPQFLKFVGRATLIGHNITFDMNFLYNEMDLSGLETRKDFETVDTIRLARQLMPRLGRYPLWLVADALGIKKSQKHRAMADVELTFDVFSRLIHLAQERNMIEEFFA
ncbi:MAG: 3'-5' exonuclease [Candidatus Omnitrophica bacterium]|nr:3'-5' exonuclease [Candidatus Omnitrophota bacterium]